MRERLGHAERRNQRRHHGERGADGDDPFAGNDGTINAALARQAWSLAVEALPQVLEVGRYLVGNDAARRKDYAHFKTQRRAKKAKAVAKASDATKPSPA